MRGFLAVFEREVIERRLLVGAALLLSLVPLVTPWLPGLQQRDVSEVRAATAMVLALCFSFGLALILGASVIGRDLAERRLGFYFSRPIPGWSIWAGKLAAAFVLALCAEALILLPTAVLERGLDAGGGSLELALDSFAPALLWSAALLFLVLMSHAAGVALRSRSPWLALDFVGLGLAAGLAWVAIRRLFIAEAYGPARIAAIGLLAAGMLALLAGGAGGVQGGRTDIRRGHGLLSLTLWGALLAACFAAQGYASWVLAAEPEDLDSVYVTGTAAQGSWIAITGPARYRADYHAEFLLDTSSGRFTRVRSLFPLSFSADGRWAVWMEPQGHGDLRNGRSYELLRLNLGDPQARPERTRMTYSGAIPRFAVSPDGRKVAVALGRRLTIEEVPAGRLLASAELPRKIERYGDRLMFMGSGRPRIFGYDLFSGAVDSMEPDAFEIAELRDGVVRVARFEQVTVPQVSPDGARVLVRRRSDHRFALFDAGTGAQLGELPAVGKSSWASFLDDGRIALVIGVAEKELQIFSPALAPEHVFRLKGVRSVRLGGLPAPDRLVVATAPRGPYTARWDLGKTLVLDLASGSRRPIGRGLTPAGSLLPAAALYWEPQSIAAADLFLTREGRLVRVDLRTGRQTVLAGRPAG